MSRVLIVEADGGSRGNPGPAAFGALVRDAETGAILVEIAEFIGVASNNVAEYRGAIAGLEAAKAINPAAHVDVRLDSKLVVEQMSGRWKIRHPNMQDLAQQARSVLAAEQVKFTWVPRSSNTTADALVNEILESALADGPMSLRRESLLDGVDDVVGSAEEDYAQALVAETRPPNQMIGWADLGTPTMTLLARHGATQYSLEKRFSGSGGVDLPLAPLGVAQAEALAAELQFRGGIDHIVSSPMLRAKQTAAIVGRALELDSHINDDLAECDFGLWDGHTFAEVQRGWPEQMTEWLASSSTPPPQGESLDHCATRVDIARRRIIEEFGGTNVLVVAHVTPIKLFVAKALGAPVEVVFRMELAPCSLTTLSWYPDGNASMFGFSDAAHLREVPSPHGT
jgi:ribonuclease H / adenosylcobalamin/alpha-ribazole phosphatase